MLLDEPSETRADFRFNLFGFPIRVHPLFWLVMVLLGIGSVKAESFRGVVSQLVIWTVAAFVSVLIHELGHAFVLRWYGLRPSITLYGFGGYASYDRAPAGGRMPGNLGQIVISAAGPGLQLALVVVIAAGLFFADHAVGVYKWGPMFFLLPGEREIVFNDGVTLLVRDLMLVSAFWAYFNLVPVFPLDGGKIARGLFVLADPRQGVRQSLLLSIGVGVGLAILGLATQDRMMMYFFLFLTYANAQALQSHGG
jgi:Zn-dependent protease